VTLNVSTLLLPAVAALTVSLSVSAQPRTPPAADPVTGCPVADASIMVELARMQASMLDPDARPDFAAFANTPTLKALQEQEAVRRMVDWAYLCRYKEANRLQTRDGSPTVVFMGDSITEFWQAGDPSLFSRGVIKRGISGQTTPQMLVRFSPDVVALRPAAVHIMAGTNDVAGNTGPTSDEDYQNNIRAMVTLARAHDITVILASIPPAAGFTWRPDLQPAARIRTLNEWLRGYAAETKSVYVDYHSALKDDAGGLRPEFTHDGVHPHRRGYAAMRSVADRAIEQALARHRKAP
jgi:lysophospholipase L1-like esterase